MRKINRAAGTMGTAAALVAILVPSLAGCAAQPHAQAAAVAAAATAAPQPSSPAAPAAVPAAVPAAAPVTAPDPRSGASAAVADPTPGPSVEPADTALTLDLAKKLAAAGLLTGDDLPGYTSVPRATDADQVAGAAGGQLTACLGLSSTDDTLWAPHGVVFRQGTSTLTSSATVATTVDHARSDLIALGGAAGAECIQKLMSQTLAGSGLRVTSTSARVLPISVVGTDDSFVQQFSFLVQAPGRQAVSVRMLNVSARIGQVDLDLLAGGAETSMLSTADATALVATAAERVRSAQDSE
jgi:hypothetical protein